MKLIFRISVALLLLLTAGACTRHKIIPDEELAMIFHDAFLANAYIGSENVKIDSLNIYEPIFASYGYTTDDVQYTIGNFSKRKSARLGDVVEQAIARLEAEGERYDREVAILDTVDNAARRALTRIVYSDSLIRMRSLRDTSRLRMSFEVVPGEYNIRLNYLVDSIDKNKNGMKASVWLEDRAGSRQNQFTNSLRREREESFSRRFTTDTTHRRLRIEFPAFYGKPQSLSLTVRDFAVEYIPQTALAVDSLYDRQLNIRIFADEFFRAANPKDSL